MEPWQVGTISEFQRPVAPIDNGHCLNQHTGHAKHRVAEDGESSCHADDDLAAAMTSITATDSETPGQSRVSYKHHYKLIQIPFADLPCRNGATATALKAARSCVLSQVLEQHDTVFSFLSANRFLGTPHHGSVDQEAGPCINLVLIRAHMGHSDTCQGRSRSIQQIATCWIPLHRQEMHAVADNSVQLGHFVPNHEAFDQTARLGETEYAVIGIGQDTDSADSWKTATRQLDLMLRIELRFSPVNVPTELA